MDVCMVHFAPGAKLHQTLTYKADLRYTRLGGLETAHVKD